MSFVGRDLDRVGRNEFVPAREFQMRWIRLYLAAYRSCHPQSVPQEEVADVWIAVQKFSLVFCLHEIVAALIESDSEYGILRFKQYHRNKVHILQM